VRAFLIVLDSVGIGAAPDAQEYGDVGAATLPHLAEAVGGIELPKMQSLGLGNIPDLLPGGIPIRGVDRRLRPLGSYGAMQEVSKGKDTTTGHWEMAGLLLERGFTVFPARHPSFPAQLIEEFESRTGRPVIGNVAASGTEIIKVLGEQQMREGCWIVYTSADSVFQIAAHEEIIPLAELYRGCEIARELCDAHLVGRVIARPFIGRPGNFSRTENRRDFSFPPPEDTILDVIKDSGREVLTIGKLDDVFAGRGISRSIHVENNRDAQAAVLSELRTPTASFIFANLIDFDMLYGHRRDAAGYAEALLDADAFLGLVVEGLGRDEVLIVTADHGNDPTFRGSDHTREYVPLLVYRKGRPGESLGIRMGFYDIAQSLASFFGLPPLPRGQSFLGPGG